LANRSCVPGAGWPPPSSALSAECSGVTLRTGWEKRRSTRSRATESSGWTRLWPPVAEGSKRNSAECVLVCPAAAFAQLTVTTHCRDWSGSEEHTSELQSRFDLVCRLLLEKKKTHAQGQEA